MNSYEKLYGRRQEDRESPPIDLLAQVRPPQPESADNVTRVVQTLIDAATVTGQVGCVQISDEGRPVAPRPSWDEFFFRMAELASTMATCPRAHCGAAIVRHKRVLSLGFNGAPSGEPHCPSEGEALAEHLRLDHCERAVHAEVNALKNAVGNVYGATIYVYGHYAPCGNCKAQLALVGITDIRHRPGPHYGVKR